jgi:hypothetical protein
MNKCSRNITDSEYTCIELNILIQLANAYNKENKNNLIKMNTDMEIKDPNKYKKYLTNSFDDKLKSKCKKGDHKCWLTQSFIKQLSDETQETLKYYTFRPDGPKTKDTWLSNYDDIYLSLIQYTKIYPEFITYVPMPIDFQKFDDYDVNKIFDNMPKNAKIGIVINLDKRGRGGTHWVSFYTDTQTGHIYYFDSVGEKYGNEINEFINKFIKYYKSQGIKPVVKYNDIQHQYKNSECGVYSMNFILRLLRGDTFEEIIEKPISDKEIQACRNIYFDKTNFGKGGDICE